MWGAVILIFPWLQRSAVLSLVLEYNNGKCNKRYQYNI